MSDFEDLRNKLLKIQYKNGDLEKYSYYDVEAYYEQAVTGYIKELVTILRSAVTFTEKLKIEFEAAHKILENYKNFVLAPQFAIVYIRSFVVRHSVFRLSSA